MKLLRTHHQPPSPTETPAKLPKPRPPHPLFISPHHHLPPQSRSSVCLWSHAEFDGVVLPGENPPTLIFFLLLSSSYYSSFFSSMGGDGIHQFSIDGSIRGCLSKYKFFSTTWLVSVSPTGPAHNTHNAPPTHLNGLDSCGASGWRYAECDVLEASSLVQPSSTAEGAELQKLQRVCVWGCFPAGEG